MRYLLLLTLSTCLQAHAMRIPNTLSRGAVSFADGFSLNTSETPWVRTNPDKNSKEKIEAAYFNASATFTIRVDKETSLQTLSEYGNKWLKSYGQFGLEVLGHQYFQNSDNEKGLVIDLANSSAHKKIRQAIFFRNSKAIVMTCTDQTAKFEDTLKECNKLIRSFGWIEETPTIIPLDQIQKPQS